MLLTGAASDARQAPTERTHRKNAEKSGQHLKTIHVYNKITNLIQDRPHRTAPTVKMHTKSVTLPSEDGQGVRQTKGDL